MAVVIIEGGVVVLTLRDVKTVAAARKKYPALSNKMVVVGDKPSGTKFANGKFTVPAPKTPVATPESDLALAIRDLADLVGAEARAAVEVRIGSRRP